MKLAPEWCEELPCRNGKFRASGVASLRPRNSIYNLIQNQRVPPPLTSPSHSQPRHRLQWGFWRSLQVLCPTESRLPRRLSSSPLAQLFCCLCQSRSMCYDNCSPRIRLNLQLSSTGCLLSAVPFPTALTPTNSFSTVARRYGLACHTQLN